MSLVDVTVKLVLDLEHTVYTGRFKSADEISLFFSEIFFGHVSLQNENANVLLRDALQKPT